MMIKSFNPFAVWFAKSLPEQIQDKIDRAEIAQSKANDRREKIEKEYENEVLIHNLETIRLTNEISSFQEQLTFLNKKNDAL